MAFYFLLMCPNCGNRMKYHSKTKLVSSNSKKCVYCGKSFNVGKAILQEIQ